MSNVNAAQNRHSRSAEPADGLRIRLFGPVEILKAGNAVRLASKKARALLGFLALREGSEVSRDLLTGLLWGERAEEQARASLRQALSEVRGTVEGAATQPIRATKEIVAWEANAAWIDARALEAAAVSQDEKILQDATALFRGDLMEGLFIGEAAFEQWLAGERERFRLLICGMHSRLMKNAEETGRTNEALGHGLKLLAIDPLQEHVHRSVMRLYAAQGRQDAALVQYERCRRELLDRLGVKPEVETEELANALRSSRRMKQPEQTGSAAQDAGPDRTPGPLAPPERPSIAVLPFASIGTDQESGYFAEGVAEDIITELSRNKDLFVVARHSSFRVAQDNSDPAAVGTALGVRHILTGSVRRAANRLRLSVHLVGCETGNETWAERYDRDIEDLFAVQLEIARTVTSTLAGRLMALADEASAAKAPESLDAYDHVLRAQHYLQRYTRADSARARAHLEKAAAIEPSYARPYSLLCIAGLYDWFWEMSDGGLADVLATGEKALLLDDQDARTHLALGVAQLFSYRHDRAVHHLERAVALNPNDDLIAVEHGRLLMYLDRPDEGLKRVHEAMRLNPFHPNWYWNIEGRCHHTAGRYDQAIAAFERLDTPQFWNEAYLAACHAMSGRHEQAAHHVRRLHEMLPDFRLTTFRKIFPYSNSDTLERFLDTFRQAGISD